MPEYPTDRACQLIPQLRSNCEMPSEADLDWMENAVQRHTGGFEMWWEQSKNELSGRDWMRVFISIWEAGRATKIPNQH